MSRRGGRNKGGRKQMRANASKRRQTRTNASKRRGANASKREQTRANVDKRKQTLTPPFIGLFYTPLCNPLIDSPCDSGGGGAIEIAENWLLRISYSADRKLKGPAERGPFKKRQKSSKSVKNIFDTFRPFSLRAKDVKNRQKVSKRFFDTS